MNSIKISRPREQDKDALKDFFALVIRDTYKKEGIDYQVDNIKNEIENKASYLKKDFESKGKERYFLVAKMGNEIIGTIEIGPVNEHIIKGTKGEVCNHLEIGTVYVHPNHQKKGISNLLMRKILEELMDRNEDEFCLDSGYTIAKEIWRKKLGKPEYVLKDFWGEGYDHYIWRKKVKETLETYK